MSYGLHDFLRDTITELREHSPLTDLLDEPQAITEGWPHDTQSYPAVVRVQPITETSSKAAHNFQTVNKLFRAQVSVVVTQSWRNDQDAPTYRQAEIMAAAGDPLDQGLEPENLLPEGSAGASWSDVEGGRLALIQDWRIRRYTR